MGAARRHVMPWRVYALGPSTLGVLPHQRSVQADGEQRQDNEERESVPASVHLRRLFRQRRRGNWNRLPSLQLAYCGKTSGTTMYRDATGKLRDSKLIHSSTRSRRGRSARPDETGRRFFIRDGKNYYAGDTLPDGTVVRGNKLYPYIPLSTRAERREQLLEQRAAFERGNPKHRYVGIYAPNKRIKREILQALRWQTFPYPKRELSPEDRLQVVDPVLVPTTFAAASAT